MGAAEYRYSDWTHEALARAMVQAEGDIKELREQLREAEEERDRFHRESQDSAQVIGGILRVLREEGLLASRTRETTGPHRFLDRDHTDGGVCACGAQWLIARDRCVMDLGGER